MTLPAILLKSGREKAVARRHPWVFSGAVEHVSGDPQGGDTVLVCASNGEPLALGAFSPQSQIRVRIWTWGAQASIDQDFFRARLQAALRCRQELRLFDETDAVRLVNAESDGLPGLVVDQYGGLLVMQCLSCGVERWRETIAECLVAESGIERVYERSDADVREIEGLPPRTGALLGAAPDSPVLIQENGLRFWVDVIQGHKTGFYLDQRDNRKRVAAYAKGGEVLDCFCYTGGFALAALRAGAGALVAVDASPAALDLARQNLQLNGFPEAAVDWVQADVFQHLRGLRDRGRKFDLVILDPPKFAPTSAQVERAARGYKDINLLAFKLLRPGGTLATFSCSAGVSMEFFQKLVYEAALDAGVQAQIVERFYQGRDHPVSLYFPEGTYLKGLCVRVG
ncbi:MAG: class I SAM-dependent rRNA methyltransferase [Anaerolineales bacterium]|nr:class I SAM-dependent rRNA methyltransferase [Anaerolineales bacterium]